MLVPLPVHAYNYAEAEDPMAVIFKNAVNNAQLGKWDKVARQAKKGVSLQKGHFYKADHLTPQFDLAIKKKTISKTAELFAQLVYISIKEKFHSTKSENFKNYNDAKARMLLTHKSYKDILDGNVKKKDPKRSVEILKNFRYALQSIGNPGLFGIGKKPPNPDSYSRAVKKIDELLLLTFPAFRQ